MLLKKLEKIMAKKMNYKAIAMNVAGLGAGAVGGKLISKYASKMIPASFPNWALPAIKIVVGAYISETQKNPMLKRVGDGLISQSALELGSAVAPQMLSGIGEDQSIMGEYDIEGTYDSGVYGDDDIEGVYGDSEDIEGLGSDIM